MANLTGSPVVFHSDTSTVDTSQQVPLGTRGYDTSGNEYIYLQGVASTAAGNWVIFDENYATTLLAANGVGPVAIAMAAISATTKYGWYQIFGKNTIAKTDTVAADKALYIDGTAGRADDAGVAGDIIVGAYSMAADVSNVTTVSINYPHVSDDLGGTAGSVGGADTQVNFNDAGTLAGDADFTWNKVTNALYIAGTIELGHATDTTLSRSAAGVLAVEGVTVSMNAITATHTAGTIELGHATDTTLSRSAAGVLAVEGVDVVTLSATQALTNKTLGVTNTVTLKDASFTLQDDVDTTKQLRFQLSGITTANLRTLTVPDYDGTVATLAGTEALTNKTLGNTNTVTLKDTLFTLQDDGDATKQVVFQLSGLTTGNTRTITIPDSNTTIPIASQVITLAGPTAARIYTFPDASTTVVGTTDTQTLSAKTLTAPKIVSGGFIADANGNELIIFTTTASAVNEITLANAATTVNPTITASGEANVGIDINVKGTGVLRLNQTGGNVQIGGGATASELRFMEPSASGVNYTAFKAAAQAGDVTYTLPTADGAASTFLQTNGAGVLTWAASSSMLKILEPGLFALNAAGVSLGTDSQGLAAALIFADATNTIAGVWSEVAAGATSISSIKVFYEDESASALVIRMFFYTGHYDTDADGSAMTLDTTDTATSYTTGGTANRLKVITVPAGAYNGLTLDGGDLFGFQIRRDSTDAADTYNAALRIISVRILYA